MSIILYEFHNCYLFVADVCHICSIHNCMPPHHLVVISCIHISSCTQQKIPIKILSFSASFAPISDFRYPYILACVSHFYHPLEGAEEVGAYQHYPPSTLTRNSIACTNNTIRGSWRVWSIWRNTAEKIPAHIYRCNIDWGKLTDITTGDRAEQMKPQSGKAQHTKPLSIDESGHWTVKHGFGSRRSLKRIQHAKGEEG